MIIPDVRFARELSGLHIGSTIEFLLPPVAGQPGLPRFQRLVLDRVDQQADLVLIYPMYVDSFIEVSPDMPVQINEGPYPSVSAG